MARDLTVGLDLIPRREYRALYLPLAAANVLKGHGILALNPLSEAAGYLDMDLGLVTGPLDAVDETPDETPAADALGEHGFKNPRVRNFALLHGSLCPRRCGI